MLCFLETPVLRFALFPYYQQIIAFFPRWCFTWKLVNQVQCSVDISCLQMLMVGCFLCVSQFLVVFL